jgi:hypothetical protein
MKKIKIKLVVSGNLKCKIDFNCIYNWESVIFSIQEADYILSLPNSDGQDWSYSDNLLSGLIHEDQNYDLTLAVINVPLQDNYYFRRLKSNVCILSLYETREILKENNLSLENFIIQNSYLSAVVYKENRNKIPESAYSLAHHEIRGCLFDMNANKEDIVYSLAHPNLCPQCSIRLMEKQIPKNFIEDIKKELKRIRKSRFYRINDFIRAHPWWSISITAVSGIIINIVANIIYDFFKS